MAEEKDEGQERTEQATPKRREEAREKGRVAKSREVASAAIIFASLIYFYFNVGGFLDKLMTVSASIFRSVGQTVISVDNISFMMTGLMGRVFFILMPLFSVIFIVSILANVVQVGFLVSPSVLQPEFSKIDPLKGFKRLFSLNSIVELVKNILKMVTIAVVAYVVVKNEVRNFLLLADQTAWDLLVYTGRVTFKILLSTGWVLLALAIFDYAYQHWEFEKGLRMTKQEIKDEMKNTEGNPLIKGRIKRLQREMARRRMMAAVPKADVVITNPTHLAIALKYDREKEVAPRVIAKGAGFIAEKIREVAGKNAVPLVENKPLAQVLYKMVDVNGLIPENLYRSVAEVLAYVYNLRK
jgi:flagellar biosynthetic protein FlhB